jgi:hypothetical protein
VAAARFKRCTSTTFVQPLLIIAVHLLAGISSSSRVSAADAACSSLHSSYTVKYYDERCADMVFLAASMQAAGAAAAPGSLQLRLLLAWQRR